MVHVDAQDRRKQVADVLSGVERVGRVRRSGVARRNVEAAVGAELEAPAIVASGDPRDDDLFARRINLRRLALRHREARNASAVGQTVFQNVTEIDRSVSREAAMKRHSVNLSKTGDFFFQVDDEVRLLGTRIAFERKNLAILFDDKQSVDGRCAGHVQWFLELQLGKHARYDVGQRRVGRAGHSRAGPRDALVDSVGAIIRRTHGRLPK